MKTQDIKSQAIKSFDKAKTHAELAIEILKLRFASIKPSTAQSQEFGILESIADDVAAEMKKVRTKQDMLRLAVMMQRNSVKVRQLAQRM